MSWWGKFIGGAVGFHLGGPLGLLLGGLLGHKLVDKPFDESHSSQGDYDQEQTQLAYFTATFSVLGYLAKVDGRVSESEIDMARRIMEHMQLSDKQKRAAIDLFNQGKQADFDVYGVIQQFRQLTHRRNTLLRMFLEIQLHGVYADGLLHAKEREALLEIAGWLGFSAFQFEQIAALVRASLGLQGGHAGWEQSGGVKPPPSTKDQLNDAFALLGVDKDAPDTEIKKSYRRLLSQHHPDKLVSKGLPEEMIKIANEKTHQIKQAYELIRHHRGKR